MAIQPNNATLADIRHGDRSYPRVNIAQCHVCQSPHRDEIELLLIEGLSPRRILTELPDDPGVSHQSIYRHYRRGHLPVDDAMVLQRQQIRGEQRWEELGLAATAFMAHQADIADGIIHLILGLVTQGEIKLTAATLLEAARFLREIENRELEAEAGRARLHESHLQMLRVFEIVGDVLGPAALDDVYVAARAEDAIEDTLWRDEFAALRQRHSDWLDKLDAINPPERWDPLGEIQRDNRIRQRHPDDGQPVTAMAADLTEPAPPSDSSRADAQRSSAVHDNHTDHDERELLAA